MRIDGSSRTPGTSYAALGRRAGATGGFTPEAGAAPSRAADAAPLDLSAGIDTLLALQSVDDVMFKRKKAVKRGQQLLDTLDEVKADLLSGRVSESRLNQLLALIGQARERTIPGLDSVIDDVELRARVELAKFGRYGFA